MLSCMMHGVPFLETSFGFGVQGSGFRSPIPETMDFRFSNSHLARKEIGADGARHRVLLLLLRRRVLRQGSDLWCRVDRPPLIASAPILHRHNGLDRIPSVASTSKRVRGWNERTVEKLQP